MSDERIPLVEIDLSGKNLVQFTGAYKEPLAGKQFLVPVANDTCTHWRGPFEVDVKGAKCKCLKCGGEVSPMFVLEELMHQESQWMRTRAAYLDEMKRLEERSSTKCRHCGKLTRISRA